MDPVWSHLPEELAFKICNTLPSVRRVSDQFKNELIMFPYDSLSRHLNGIFDLDTSDSIVLHTIVRNKSLRKRLIKENSHLTLYAIGLCLWMNLHEDEKYRVKRRIHMIAFGSQMYMMEKF